MGHVHTIAQGVDTNEGASCGTGKQDSPGEGFLVEGPSRESQRAARLHGYRLVLPGRQQVSQPHADLQEVQLDQARCREVPEGLGDAQGSVHGSAVGRILLQLYYKAEEDLSVSWSAATATG